MYVIEMAVSHLLNIREQEELKKVRYMKNLENSYAPLSRGWPKFDSSQFGDNSRRQRTFALCRLSYAYIIINFSQKKKIFDNFVIITDQQRTYNATIL